MHLETLSLSGCRQLNSISPLHKCFNLVNLDLSLCYRLKDFESLFLLENLEYLNVSGTKFTQNHLSRINKVSSLKQIDISKCYNITHHDENMPDHVEVIQDSFENGQVEWDDSDSDNSVIFA